MRQLSTWAPTRTMDLVSLHVTILHTTMVTETSSNSVSCSGYADGFASVTVSGGQGSLTYSNGIFNNATGLFRGVVAGRLTITVTDNVGCSVEAMVTVDSPEVLECDGQFV